MSPIDSLRFQVSFFLDSIPIIFRTLKFFVYSLLYHVLRIDPKAASTSFSIDSLSSPKRRREGLYQYANGVWDDHEFRPPREGDARSPCPALNTMANHGYIPRNGKNLTGDILTQGLMDCYGLSWPLAAFLAWGGVLLLGQVGCLSLQDLARHNRVEHDASLTHPNTLPGDDYAPIHSSPELFEKFLRDAKKGRFTYKEIAQARVRRESGDVGEGEHFPKVTSVQQEIARGEVALVLQIFGGEEFAVPVDVIRKWWWEQRLPEGWKPTRTTELLETVKWSKRIREEMSAIRNGEVDEVVRVRVRDVRVEAKNGLANANADGVNGLSNGHIDGDETTRTANGVLQHSRSLNSSEDGSINPIPNTSHSYSSSSSSNESSSPSSSSGPTSDNETESHTNTPTNTTTNNTNTTKTTIPLPTFNTRTQAFTSASALDYDATTPARRHTLPLQATAAA